MFDEECMLELLRTPNGFEENERLMSSWGHLSWDAQHASTAADP